MVHDKGGREKELNYQNNTLIEQNIIKMLREPELIK
jgi:hypothetical protein